MTPAKLLIGPMLIEFAIEFSGSWLSTKWAAAPGYQPEIGLPWAAIRGVPVDRPWASSPGSIISTLTNRRWREKPVTELIPGMHGAFLEIDRAFVKWQKAPQPSDGRRESVTRNVLKG